ncbi:hypothetical protein [Streptomyces virginiae]
MKHTVSVLLLTALLSVILVAGAPDAACSPTSGPPVLAKPDVILP